MTAGIDFKTLDSALTAIALRIANANVPATTEFIEAKQRFNRLSAAQKTPVTLVVAGLKGAGKRSLVNLLLGHEALPKSAAGTGSIPVVLEFSNLPTTRACWLDGVTEDFEGSVLDTAVDMQPDYIILGLNNTVLRDVRFIASGALDDPNQMWQTVELVEAQADCMVWCTRATDPLPEEELQVLEVLPSWLEQGGRLALTQADLIQDFAPVRDRLSAARARFASVLPIATKLALKAGDDGNIWAASGAERLVADVQDLLAARRLDRLVEARQDLLQCLNILAPALKVNSGATPKAFAGDVEEAAVESADLVACPPSGSPSYIPASGNAAGSTSVNAREADDALVVTWRERFDRVRRRLDTGGYADNEAFVTAAQVMVEEFMQDMAEPDLLPLRADWLFDEFERANDLLILLQFENSDGVAVDGARVLLQLDDAVRQAAASRDEPQETPTDQMTAIG